MHSRTACNKTCVTQTQQTLKQHIKNVGFCYISPWPNSQRVTLILVAIADPGLGKFELVFVPPFRNQVEVVVSCIECVDTPGLSSIGMKHLAHWISVKDTCSWQFRAFNIVLPIKVVEYFLTGQLFRGERYMKIEIKVRIG